jgi:hypothetical protein
VTVVPKSSSKVRRLTPVALLLAFGALPGACAEERPPTAPDRETAGVGGTSAGTTSAGGGGTSAGGAGGGGTIRGGTSAGGTSERAGGGGELTSAQGGEAGELTNAQGGEAGGSAEPAFPCDVSRIIQAKCERCHSDPPENGAPFPLLSWEDTQKPYGRVLVHDAMLVAVESGFMPLTELELSPPVEDLTTSERTDLLSWLRAGAEPDRSGATCAP